MAYTVNFIGDEYSEPEVQGEGVRVVLNGDQGKADNPGGTGANAETYSVKF